MSGLPAGWVQTTLGELAAPERGAITDGPFGSNLTSAHYTEAGARVIRLENIGDGFFRNARSFVPLEHFEALRKHEALPGDLVVASLGENLPRACLLPDLGDPALVKADCIRIRLRQDVHPKWALYALQAPTAKQWAADRLRGVGRQRLGLTGIREIPVNLPPFDEQHRIVDIVEDHVSRLAAAGGYVRSGEERVAGLGEAMLRSSLADGWPDVPLRQLLAEPLANGRSVPDGRGARVLRLTALKAVEVDTAASKQGSWTHDEAVPFFIRKGDLLLARGNGSLALVGRAAVVGHDPSPVAFPDTMIRVRPDEKAVDPSLLLTLWNSRYVRRQIEAVVRTTAGIYKVNQKQLLDIRVPVPPRDEQARAVSAFESIAVEARRLQSGVSAIKRRNQALRASVLSAAFAGWL